MHPKLMRGRVFRLTLAFVAVASLATGAVSAPVDDNGTYLLLQITSRTPTPYSNAKAAVADAVQLAGSAATQKALTADERRSSVSLNPQYGRPQPFPVTLAALDDRALVQTDAIDGLNVAHRLTHR